MVGLFEEVLNSCCWKQKKSCFDGGVHAYESTLYIMSQNFPHDITLVDCLFFHFFFEIE